MGRIVFGVDVDVVGVEEKVLSAEEGVRKGLVGVVDEGGEGAVGGPFVGVVEGLDGEEFAAEGRERDREWAAWIGWGAVGESGGEEGIGGCGVWAGGLGRLIWRGGGGSGC